MIRGVAVTPAGEAVVLVCGRSDCDQPAAVIRLWRSGSGRSWRTTACDVHEVERDAASTLPGFTFEAEHRIEAGKAELSRRHKARDGAQTPSQVG